jgi:pimeloyl-ACP methyl ester carboxylesterase
MPLAGDLYYFYHAQAEGEKLPVVFLHGAGGSHLVWGAEVRRLPGCRIYALDLPGHGKSAGRGQQSIAAYTQAVLDWLAAVGLHRAVFVGHSMGGAIALALALDFPDQVLGLGLVNSAANLPVNPAILEAAASPSTFLEAVKTITAWSYHPSASPRLVELAEQRMAETRPAVLYGDLLACDAFDVTGRVGAVRAPALVVCGASDRMTPLRHSQFLAGAIPGARLEVIAEAGHMTPLEQPQALARLLSQWLAGIPYP